LLSTPKPVRRSRKRALGIRVVTLDGALIGWVRHYFAVALILVFAVFWIVGCAWGWLVLTDAEFASLGLWSREQRMVALATAVLFVGSIPPAPIWVWSEVIVCYSTAEGELSMTSSLETIVIKVA
jgi:hypothetical protein